MIETPTAVSESNAPAITMVQALHDAIREEMARDSTVVLMGQDVGRKGGVFKVSQGLIDEFGPLRVVDTPISEALIAGAAIGAAMMGLRPIAEFQFADYMHPAYDQIVNQAATIRWRTLGRWGVPAVFRAPIGAGVRGGIYHSQSVEALYCHIPGLRVVAPATPADAKGLLKASIRSDDPIVFLEHKRCYRAFKEVVPDSDSIVPIGLARLDREGRDISLITYGIGVFLSRSAADLLEKDGISVEILDLRTVSPLDSEAIAATVRKTGRVVVVHEANRTMGVGAEIAAFIAGELFMDLDAPVSRIGGADCHLAYNSAEEDAVIPNTDSVVAEVRRLVRF